MTRKRWWEVGQQTIEDEQELFAEYGLDFVLDQELFDRAETVVFRGELRLGRRRTPARIAYPPTYADGGHPTVTAPDLYVGRHITPDGHLCLDHAVPDATQPMSGAEAVLRAERLWHLWEKAPDQLRDEEADTPDQKVNYFRYTPGAAVALGDVELGEAQRGFLTVHVSEGDPFRGTITHVRSLEPRNASMTPTPALVTNSTSEVELTGEWFRSDTLPPYDATELALWLRAEHTALYNRQLLRAHQSGIPGAPAVFGIVFKDEGPTRGQEQDTWLLLTVTRVSHDSHRPVLARVLRVRATDRWLRQPQLEPVADKSVCVIGLGAVGSPVADMLARAGVGDFQLVDYDYLSVGNRVRHNLDLGDLGENKARAMASRLKRIDPWTRVESLPFPLGITGGTDIEHLFQAFDDQLVAGLQRADLIVNATAHASTSTYISRLAAEAGIPALHVWVSSGAWGGRVLLQRPERASACWNCLALAQQRPEAYEEVITVPVLAEDPARTEVNEQGCADPTFTGPAFDINATAVAAARTAVSYLLAGTGYPALDYDLATLHLRRESTGRSETVYSQLPAHPECTTCKRTP